MASKKRAPKPRAKRGPKTDAEKAALVRWYFEIETRRHP
jgi:hypothetical protein